MTFHIGQRVTPKRNVIWHAYEGSPEELGILVPQYGVIYTVRALDMWDTPFIRLNEIRNVIGLGGINEPSFKADCFRPVVDTSIEVFRQMLNPTPEKSLTHQKDKVNV